jgi:2-polyprenyl-3-methyl-5-hydroxy-6-metoxy-1,4-benzoquinol methylase
MNDNPTEQLLRSWEANAEAWSDAIANAAIPSRVQVTDAAVMEAILDLRARRVLDLGCGEGWLVRALSATGVEVVGVDASASLLARAREGGGGAFHLCSYAQMAANLERAGTGYDVIVCNFSLLQEELSPLLMSLRQCLRAGGALVIQTTHPWSSRGEAPYKNGWRMETFAPFGDGFREPMPWYFRTLQAWIELLIASGYRIVTVREPTHRASWEPASILFIVTTGTDPASP